MSKTASTLSIRLQLPPDEEATTQPKPPQVEYLWDRIIFAAIAAAVIVTAVIAGAWYWFATPQQNLNSEPAIAVASEAPATAKPLSAPPTPADANGVALGSNSSPSPAAEPAVADAHSTEPASAPAAATQAAEASSATTTQVGQQALAKVANSTAAPAPTTAQTLAEPSAAPSSSSSQASAAVDSTPTHNSRAPLAKVEILSQHLAHAQLSTEFENRQPLNDAGAVIPMNDGGLVTVYLYTELTGLQGETLYYNWYYDDKRVARVRARPQRELTRAYSSKYIDRHMLGQWHVELSSAGGDALARAEFEVR